MKLSGWGRYPVLKAQVHRPRDLAALRHLVLSEDSVIARGNGRSYGDSAINPGATLDMRSWNRMLAFAPQTGQLVAEAGVLLGDIVTAFLPRGWFLQVTPGTRHVTLGGAIAADVHGKNHHKDGSFRGCVDWIEIMGADGTVTRASSNDDPELFDHTLGGMGLTGIILRAAIRLRKVETGWVRQTTIVAPNLQAAMAAFEQAQDATYSVAWIDCLQRGADLGRALVKLGEHASLADLPPALAAAPLDAGSRRERAVPFDFPSLALNRFSVRAFNALYFRAGMRQGGTALVDWDSYFYPLDAIAGWNRIYGRKGFAQFQCVLPTASSKAGLTALLQATAAAGLGSFLAVLKRLGPQDSAFSFPMEGYTLAMDFPVSRRTLTLLDQLDRITLEHGGRFYLAKDARMSAATLRAADARTQAFQDLRARRGATGRFSSAQAQRLQL